MFWYNPFTWFGSDDQTQITNKGQQVIINHTVNTNNEDLEIVVCYLATILTVYIVVKLHKQYVKFIRAHPPTTV